MLNFIKKLTIILIALTFSGCQSSRIPGQSSNLVLNNEKALIVFTASLKSSSFPGNSSSAIPCWENINKKDEIFPSESDNWEAIDRNRRKEPAQNPIFCPAAHGKGWRGGRVVVGVAGTQLLCDRRS